MNKTFNEVIVVEGNHDKSKVLSIFPNADVVITNGKEISEETLDSLSELNQARGLILLLDPDVPGEAIRKRINAYVGPTKHVFIAKKECIDTVKQKVGIEHAPSVVIEKALMNHVHTETTKQKSLNRQALMQRGLLGHPNASKKRQKVIEAYNLGLCNGKTFYKKLKMFNITLKMIDAVI